MSKLPSSLENVRTRGTIEFDRIFDYCINLKKYSVVGLGRIYLTRPLLGTIKVLELSFDDWDKLATQYVIIDNINRLRMSAEGLKYLLKYLESPKCLNLKDSVLQSISTYGSGYF
jgi:hypothetical protein